MTRTTDSYPPVHSARLTSRLDREWERLRHRPGNVLTARSWPIDLAGAPRLTDLQQIVDATQATVAGADARLRAIVGVARDDQLAGQVVLRRILPGLIAGAARYARHRDADDPMDLAVAAAWQAIVAYDTERRPHHIAAALISDSIDRAFRRSLRRRSAGEITLAPMSFVEMSAADLGARRESSALEELAEIVREARSAGVPASDLEFVRRYVQAESPAALARDEGVTTRTIWNRRDRAVRGMRSAVLHDHRAVA